KNRNEQLFIRAQRRMDTRVQGTHFHTAGGSLHERIGHEKPDGSTSGSYYRSVKDGVHLLNEQDQCEEIQGSRYSSVKDCEVEQCREYYLQALDNWTVNTHFATVQAPLGICLRVDDENYIL